VAPRSESIPVNYSKRQYVILSSSFKLLLSYSSGAAFIEFPTATISTLYSPLLRQSHTGKIMITGIHLIIYSKNQEADNSFFRDILQLTNVDVGHGWLIFGLPPSELAVHPSPENDHHEIFLMCDDIKLFVRQLSMHKITCSEIQNQGWGQLVQLTLPGGGKLGVYQPGHARPKPMKVKTASIKTISKKTTTKKAGSKKPGSK